MMRWITPGGAIRTRWFCSNSTSGRCKRCGCSEGKPLGPETGEALVLVHASDNFGHLGRFLTKARTPRGPTGDHGHIEVQHRQILAEEVVARTHLGIHPPPAISPSFGGTLEDHCLVDLIGGEPTRIVSHP